MNHTKRQMEGLLSKDDEAAMERAEIARQFRRRHERRSEVAPVSPAEARIVIPDLAEMERRIEMIEAWVARIAGEQERQGWRFLLVLGLTWVAALAVMALAWRA